MTRQADSCSRLCVEQLPVPTDTDIVELFARFSSSPWAMLLDSANAEHPDSRFDIFVADPIATCVTKGQITYIHNVVEQTHVESDDDPVALLADIQTELFGSVTVDKNIPDLPFMAGLMGAFGYDLGPRFESLPVIAEDSSSAPDMAVGAYTWSVVKDNTSGSFFLCYLEGFPHPSIESVSMSADATVSEPFYLTSDWQANMDKAAYTSRINRIHDYLVAGDCYQVNLAQRFTASYSGNHWDAYLTLRSANKAPFSAYINLPEQAFLSISPERFLSVKDNQVQTKPIKGTQPRNSSTEQDAANRQRLLSSEKDKAENLMIVDLLRNDLSRTCEPGTVMVPELFSIESFAAVHHLVSTVTGTLKHSESPLTLLKNAFPGGSITGAPKIRAMEIIEELEPHRRNIYCGSIGYIGVRNDMDTSICIRTLLCEESQIHCWAGGGIVLDSDADAEYQECLDKVSRILPVLTEAK